MCTLKMEFNKEQYERLWVADTQEEAIALTAYRLRLDRGDVITLTTGETVIVVENLCEQLALTCVRLVMGERYNNSAKVFTVPYTVITNSMLGKGVLYEDFVRIESANVCRRLIADENWGGLADTLDIMRELSIDISEFANDLSTMQSIVAYKERMEQLDEELVAHLYGADEPEREEAKKEDSVCQ